MGAQPPWELHSGDEVWFGCKSRNLRAVSPFCPGFPCKRLLADRHGAHVRVHGVCPPPYADRHRPHCPHGPLSIGWPVQVMMV